MLEKYRSAQIVITSRIHAALPCVALGVPVIFILLDHLPGGGGKRTWGLTDLFHTLDLSGREDVDVDLFKDWVANQFDWKDPPPNPNFGKRTEISYLLNVDEVIQNRALRNT